MDKNDLFEVLKGTVKMISLDQLIQQRVQKLEDFCMTHYTADDLVRLEGRKQMYNDEDYWYQEPTFPAGKKKILIRQYNTFVSRLLEIKQLRDRLIELAFTDYRDADYDVDFKVDTITVRKT